MGMISIEDMRFFAYHGCFAEEAKTGRQFRVDLFFETDTLIAEETDKLDDTVNYRDVYHMIKEEMEIRSHLLEHVARRIMDRLVRDFEGVLGAEVTVAKLHPPVDGQVGSVSVTLSTGDISLQE